MRVQNRHHGGNSPPARTILHGGFAPLLLLLGPMAAFAAAPASDRNQAGAEVFSCRFDEGTDRNYDAWPDAWTRRRGPGFPQYISIKIGDEAPPSGGRSLHVELDGGGATVYSPPIAIDPHSDFVLEGFVKAERLHYDRAWLSLVFLDDKRQPMGQYASRRTGATKGWERLSLGPATPARGAKTAMVALHVAPEGTDEDLRGTVLFGDLRLVQWPRIALTARCEVQDAAASSDRRAPGVGNLFPQGSGIEIACSVSGLANPDARVAFVLEDAVRQPVADQALPLASVSATEAISRAVWKPAIPGRGFYRVRAVVDAGKSELGRSELTFAVIETQEAGRAAPGRSSTGEFGWTLPGAGKPLTLDQLSDLLGHAGIHRIKFPFGPSRREGSVPIDQVVEFSERLAVQGIEIVGLLDRVQAPGAGGQENDGKQVLDPDPRTRNPFLGDPKTWYLVIEPIMGRLATQIRCWQLANDTDISLAGIDGLGPQMAEVKKTLDRIGQDVCLGMAWNWSLPLPKASTGRETSVGWTSSPSGSGDGLKVHPTTGATTAQARPPKSPPWSFLALLAGASMTERELGERLDATKASGLGRWVSLEALPKDEHSPPARAEHLVKRMVVAKIHGAEGIFCADPFDARRGLLREDGTPEELFLPWRTAATVLGGAQHLGSMELPNGSTSHVFTRQNEVAMVLWNDRPVEETVYLGDKIRQLDVWGQDCGAHARRVTVPVAQKLTVPVARSMTVATAYNEPARHAPPPLPRASETLTLRDPPPIHVDRLPTFLLVLSEPVVRWQLAADFGSKQLPSVAGQRHANSLRLKNSFDKAVSGRAVLSPPQGWRLAPRVIEFQLTPQEDRQWPLEITLPADVINGPQPVRIEFELLAQRDYRFAISRQIEVGYGDVKIETSTRLNDQGDLEVEQTLTNRGKQAVGFRCELLAPDRRRETVQVVGLPPGRDSKTYRLPDGKELLGKTLWLRATEIGGARVLNYRLVATAPSNSQAAVPASK